MPRILWAPVFAAPLLLVLWWSWSQRCRQQKEKESEDQAADNGKDAQKANNQEAEHSQVEKPKWTKMTKAEKKAQKAAKQAAKSTRIRGSAEGKMAELESRLNLALFPESETVVLASVDVEAWEGGPSLVTEIGLAFFVARKSGSTFRHRHILIEEHLALRNGKFVADNRDHFLYGDSEVLPLIQAVAEVSTELGAADFIVGHAVAGDLKWLRSIGVGGINKHSPKTPTGSSSTEDNERVEVPLEDRLVDTQMLAVACAVRAARANGSASDSVPAVKQPSLNALATEYDLEPDALHNGANDAAFTLQVMLSQCKVPFEPPPRTPSTHMHQVGFREKQAIADAAAGAQDEDRKAEVQALVDRVGAFAQALEEGDRSADPLVADPLAVDPLVADPLVVDPLAGVAEAEPAELRFPPSLSAFERKAVHGAAADLGLSSCSQGSGADRYIAVRAAGAFPEFAKRRSDRRGMTKKKQLVRQCLVCGIEVSGDEGWTDHQSGKKHLKKLLEAQAGGDSGGGGDERSPLATKKTDEAAKL
jgi:hypothetical protein